MYIDLPFKPMAAVTLGYGQRSQQAWSLPIANFWLAGLCGFEACAYYEYGSWVKMSLIISSKLGFQHWLLELNLSGSLGP